MHVHPKACAMYHQSGMLTKLHCIAQEANLTCLEGLVVNSMCVCYVRKLYRSAGLKVKVASSFLLNATHISISLLIKWLKTLRSCCRLSCAV